MLWRRAFESLRALFYWSGKDASRAIWMRGGGSDGFCRQPRLMKPLAARCVTIRWSLRPIGLCVWRGRSRLHHLCVDRGAQRAVRRSSVLVLSRVAGDVCVVDSFIQSPS